MSDRTIVLIPSETDTDDPQYWDNFVFRVRAALVAEYLTFRLVVVNPKTIEPVNK